MLAALVGFLSLVWLYWHCPRGCNTGILIPIVPPVSSKAFRANSLPLCCVWQTELPLGDNRWIVLAFTKPLAVPKQNCMFIHPSVPNRKRRFDGCDGTPVHQTVPGRELTRRTNTPQVCCLTVSTAHRRCMLAAHGTCRVHSWHVHTRSRLDCQLDRSEMHF